MSVISKYKCNVFADRDTLEKALDYAQNVAKACGKGNEAAVLTAVHVVLNTAIGLVEKEEVVA